MKKVSVKKPNNIIILTSILIVGTLAIGAVFIYMPFLNKSKYLRDEILRERERNILTGKIRGLGKHLKIYEERVPNGRSVSWLLNDVSEMATKEYVDISSIKPGAPEDRGQYTKLYVVMDIICTYHQLGRFVSRVESSEKFLRIESVDMKRLDTEDDYKDKDKKQEFEPFDVKATIVISTIVLKE